MSLSCNTKKRWVKEQSPQGTRKIKKNKWKKGKEEGTKSNIQLKRYTTTVFAFLKGKKK